MNSKYSRNSQSVDQAMKTTQIAGQIETRNAYNKVSTEFYCTDCRGMKPVGMRSKLRIGACKRPICTGCEVRRKKKVHLGNVGGL